MGVQMIQHVSGGQRTTLWSCFVSFQTIMWVPEIEHGLPSVHSKYFHLLAHFVGSPPCYTQLFPLMPSIRIGTGPENGLCDWNRASPPMTVSWKHQQ